MYEPLNNPVYNALKTGDAHFNQGRGQVRFFNEEVSPFAGFSDDYDKGFDDLYRLLDKKNIGDTVNFEVYRSGKTMTVPVKLTSSPTNSGTPVRRGVQ